MGEEDEWERRKGRREAGTDLVIRPEGRLADLNLFETGFELRSALDPVRELFSDGGL